MSLLVGCMLGSDFHPRLDTPTEVSFSFSFFKNYFTIVRWIFAAISILFITFNFLMGLNHVKDNIQMELLLAVN